MKPKSAKLKKLRQWLFLVTFSQGFELFINVSIILNCVSLSLDRYPISYEESITIDILNLFFYFVFMFEMVMKIAALGFKDYF